MESPHHPGPRPDAEIQGLRDGGAPGVVGVFPPPEQRLLRLMAEFRRRQRERPDMVVRPWLSQVPDDSPDPGIGFVVEYCPRGGDIAELRVRHDRAVAEGPAGSGEASLCLVADWRFDGADVRGPELMVNHLLRLAERTLG
ncbi:MAG: hypothetical protein KY466_11820 [Gemmatimonadetes bacterium]|nr:hypothetical protein [Gemmatimonadota bacterium]